MPLRRMRLISAIAPALHITDNLSTNLGFVDWSRSLATKTGTHLPEIEQARGARLSHGSTTLSSLLDLSLRRI